MFTQVFAMSYQCIEHLSGDVLARYRAKIHLIGLDSCPYQYPGDSWIDNPKEMAERAIPGRIHVSSQDTRYVIQF